MDLAVVKLHLTKGGKRRGREEAVVLDTVSLVRLVQALRPAQGRGNTLSTGGAKALRTQFQQLVAALGLTQANLQFYSLRRGGATKLFNDTGSFDTCAEAGRWSSVRTARVYIDTALQVQHDMLSEQMERRLHKAQRIWRNLLQT